MAADADDTNTIPAEIDPIGSVQPSVPLDTPF